MAEALTHILTETSPAGSNDAFLKDLFEITKKIIDTAPEVAERALYCLIKKTTPEEVWYPQVHYMLWEIEKAKSVEKRSPWSHLTLAECAPEDAPFLPDLFKSYSEWLNLYKNPNWLNLGNIRNHVDWMLTTIDAASDARSLNSSYRHLIDTTTDSLWEMINFLKENNFQLYLYALEAGMREVGSEAKLKSRIEQKFASTLIAELREYCVSNTNDAASIITYMIEQSRYPWGRVRRRRVLDETYPVLLSVNESIAKEALRAGLRFEGYFPFSKFWHPSPPELQR